MAADQDVRLRGRSDVTDVDRTLSVVYVATVANLLCGQLFNLVLFFVLAPAQVGLINWGTAGVGILFYIADLGVDTSLVVAMKQKPVSLAVSTTVVGLIRGGVAAAALIFWILGRQLGFFGPEESVVLLLIGLTQAVRSLGTPFVAHLQVRDRQATVAIIQVLPVAFRFVGVVALWLAHDLGVTSALVVWLSGETVGLLVLAGVARAEPHHGESADMHELVRDLLRSAPAIALSQALLAGQNRADWLIVAALTSYASLANYSIANKALELLILAGSVFGRNALPWFVEGWDARNLSRNIRFLNAMLVIGGLGLAVWGATILHLVFGNKYAAAAPVIPVMAALAPALGMYQLSQFASFARGKARYAVISGGIGLAGQIAVDLFAVPRFGIIGAAWGMCVYAGLALPISLYLGRREVIPGRAATELLLTAAVLPATLLLGSMAGIGGRA